MFQQSYADGVFAVLDSVLMVLTILMGWLALGALAVFFVYCCSRVSNGERNELANDDFVAEPPRPSGKGASLSADWAVPAAYERRRAPDRWQPGR